MVQYREKCGFMDLMAVAVRYSKHPKSRRGGGT